MLLPGFIKQLLLLPRKFLFWDAKPVQFTLATLAMFLQVQVVYSTVNCDMSNVFEFVTITTPSNKLKPIA